ncbi:hypothetical protein ACTQ6A_12860 [Lachnospiraceae bacterium LCP25S3_G4]
MKKNVLKNLLITFIAILVLRYIYVTVTRESFINGVFISSTLGLLIATTVVTIVFYKGRKK